MKRWFLVFSFLIILGIIQGCKSTSSDSDLFDEDRCASEIGSQIELTLKEKIGNFSCVYSGNQVRDFKYGEIWEAENGCIYLIHTRTIKGQVTRGTFNYDNDFWNDATHYETRMNMKVIGYAKNENVQYCDFLTDKQPKNADCAFDKTFDHQKCIVIEENPKLSVEQGFY